MTSVVVTCERRTPPSAIIRGLTTPTYDASWIVIASDIVSGTQILELASDPSLPDPIPALGDPYEYTSDDEEWKETDPNALALDFRTSPVFPQEEDHRYAWRVDVTWREPDANRNESPDLKLDPMQREPMYWIEYGTTTETLYLGRPVTNETNGTVGDEEIMVNAVADPFPPIVRPRLTPIIVIAKNVLTPIVALDRNEDFELSINSKDFTLLGKTIKKHFARFVRADTGNVQYYNGLPYYQMFTRIEISRKPWYEYRFNEGPRFTETYGLIQGKDSDGIPLPGPFPLKTDGTLATDPVHYNNKPYLVLAEKDFATLLT